MIELEPKACEFLIALLRKYIDSPEADEVLPFHMITRGRDIAEDILELVIAESRIERTELTKESKE